MKLFVDSILFSYAQIFFSSRRWFGGVVLLSTFIVPELGLVALLGVVVSNLTAYLLKFDETKIRNGFYGFNGILFGAAAVFYFKLTLFLLVLVFVFIIITFFVSAVLEHHLAAVFNLPGLSLPFVVTLYIFVIFLTNFNFIQPRNFEFIDYAFLGFLPPIVKTYFKSFALIVFQSSIVSGIIFAVAILFFSRVMFILSVIGFLVNQLFVQLIMPQHGETFVVLSSFNSILTSFALGGNLIIPSKKSFLLTVISSLMIVILTGFFSKLLSPYLLPVLVLPFNFIVLSVLYSLKFRREQSDLVLLYFQPGSPEENYYYHHNRLSRFEKFKALVPELPFFGQWTVSQAHNGTVTHKDKWKFAWDFVVKDEKGSEYTGSGTALKDYYCYKLPAVAPLDGTVVRIVDSVPNNEIGEVNLKLNWGNTVIVDHGNGVFSSLSHLEPYSTKLSAGDKVKKGDIIGACGNSGRSPTPHLHFQFQATDKLGDKTIEYPLCHYLEKKDGSFILHSFDHPAQDMVVQNLETHKLIKKAFDFTYGDKLTFQCKLDEQTFDEEWEVNVDIYNNLFIESSAGATAYIAVVGKILYLINFIGNKRSALYYFYLMSVQVPLCYEPNLYWKDRYPLSKVLNNAVRYLSEFFLAFSQQINAEASFAFEERTSESNDYVITNRISVKGSGVFAFYNETWEGRLTVDPEGFIKTITVTTPQQSQFHATAKTIEEKSE